jgi:hypothetical protein
VPLAAFLKHRCDWFKSICIYFTLKSRMKLYFPTVIDDHNIYCVLFVFTVKFIIGSTYMYVFMRSVIVICEWTGHEYVLQLDEFPDRKLKTKTTVTYLACQQEILWAPPLYC